MRPEHTSCSAPLRESNFLLLSAPCTRSAEFATHGAQVRTCHKQCQRHNLHAEVSHVRIVAAKSSAIAGACTNLCINAIGRKHSALHMKTLDIVQLPLPLPEFSALGELLEHFVSFRRMASKHQPLPSRNNISRPSKYEGLKRRAVTLARKQDFVGASRCFEAFLQLQPAEERTWICYAQVRHMISCIRFRSQERR